MTIKFDARTNTINLDMDGVLADFDRFVLERMGRTFEHKVGPDADLEMWTFLHGIPHMYFQLEPTPYAFELMDAAKSITSNVEILTAIPRRKKVPSAEQDKRDWIAKYFGTDIVVKIGPHSADKWKHCKLGDVLVDDRDDNISDWITKGQGVGIFHEYRNHQKTLDALALLR